MNRTFIFPRIDNMNELQMKHKTDVLPFFSESFQLINQAGKIRTKKTRSNLIIFWKVSSFQLHKL